MILKKYYFIEVTTKSYLLIKYDYVRRVMYMFIFILNLFETNC